MNLVLGAVAAATVALLLTPAVIRRAPERLTRLNVNGRPVPAILGIPLVAAALAGISTVALVQGEDNGSRVLVAVAVALVAMGAAGWVDDLRGDERERGFRGHFRALARGSITGGLVKIAAGIAVGVIAALLVAQGVGDRVMVALIVPLTANLVNLLDRAPGRAGKVGLVLLGTAAVAGPVGVAAALVGPLAALLIVLIWDLGERGMLGDAGANSVGAAAGLGAALALGGAGRGLFLGLLLAANLASERWSFSAAIAHSGFLRRLDMLGRGRG